MKRLFQAAMCAATIACSLTSGVALADAKVVTVSSGQRFTIPRKSPSSVPVIIGNLPIDVTESGSITGLVNLQLFVRGCAAGPDGHCVSSGQDAFVEFRLLDSAGVSVATQSARLRNVLFSADASIQAENSFPVMMHVTGDAALAGTYSLQVIVRNEGLVPVEIERKQITATFIPR